MVSKPLGVWRVGAWVVCGTPRVSAEVLMGVAARTGCPVKKQRLPLGIRICSVSLGSAAHRSETLGGEYDDHAALGMTIHRVSLKMEVLPLDQ